MVENRQADVVRRTTIRGTPDQTIISSRPLETPSSIIVGQSSEVPLPQAEPNQDVMSARDKNAPEDSATDTTIAADVATAEELKSIGDVTLTSEDVKSLFAQ